MIFTLLVRFFLMVSGMCCLAIGIFGGFGGAVTDRLTLVLVSLYVLAWLNSTSEGTNQ